MDATENEENNASLIENVSSLIEDLKRLKSKKTFHEDSDNLDNLSTCAVKDHPIDLSDLSEDERNIRKENIDHDAGDEENHVKEKKDDKEDENESVHSIGTTYDVSFSALDVLEQESRDDSEEEG